MERGKWIAEGWNKKRIGKEVKEKKLRKKILRRFFAVFGAVRLKVGLNVTLYSYKGRPKFSCLSNIARNKETVKVPCW